MDQPKPQPLFLADSAGLDFLNSIATPIDIPVDSIDSGEGLLAWLEQAQLVPAATIAALKERALPDELDNVAAQARQLREWFRAFVLARKGKPLPADALQDLERLNRLLEREETFQRIEPAHDRSTGAFEVASVRRWRSPDALLLPIADALARVVSDEDFTHIKACEGPSCTLLFADHTRGRARRWCSMGVCGNRAKVAAHRQRQKGQR